MPGKRARQLHATMAVPHPHPELIRLLKATTSQRLYIVREGGPLMTTAWAVPLAARWVVEKRRRACAGDHVHRRLPQPGREGAWLVLCWRSGLLSQGWKTQATGALGASRSLPQTAGTRSPERGRELVMPPERIASTTPGLLVILVDFWISRCYAIHSKQPW